MKNIFSASSSSLALCFVLACIATDLPAEENVTDDRPGIAPDIRDDRTRLKLQRGDIVIVPIPMSNPTFGSGLIVGGAYFYSQTEEQARKQPASLTAAGALYTSNDSKGFVIAQQNYWKEDRWRFTGVMGAADVRLELLAPDETSDGTRVDYKVGGPLLLAKLSRRLSGDWYGGIMYRLVHASQAIAAGTDTGSSDFDIGDVTSSGFGLTVEYDSRDMPMNSYGGAHFKIEGLFNEEAVGSDNTYQSYSAFFRVYRPLSDSVVLAWEAQACQRVGPVPLWDTCTVELRGFPATDYLGSTSLSSQLEARWKFSNRWGIVGFGGVGDVGDSFSGLDDDKSIPSYGIGVRFMVLQSKRINMRLDYARSGNSDAVYLAVGEAF